MQRIALVNWEMTVASAAAPTPHAKPSDKKQVEHNIDARRYDQIDQRVTAVANGLQDADENVIHDKTKRSCKIGTEIFDGLRQDIGRCSHQHKDFRRQIHAKHSQRCTVRQVPNATVVWIAFCRSSRFFAP